VWICWNGIGEEMMKTPEEMAQQYVSTIADTHSVKAACEKAFIAGYKAAQALINGRKIIQITGTTQDLIALCDDGTLWFNERAYDPKGVSDNCNWHKIRSIPQDE
jgi:hypothetical protein